MPIGLRSDLSLRSTMPRGENVLLLSKCLEQEAPAVVVSAVVVPQGLAILLLEV